MDAVPAAAASADTNPDRSNTSAFIQHPSTVHVPNASTGSSPDPILENTRISAIFGNTRGLFPKSNQSKVSYYDDLAKENNSPFICLTDSHLKPQVVDAEIQMKGMTIYRTDRKQREGGGVISYVRQDLAVNSVLQHSNSFCDILGL